MTLMDRTQAERHVHTAQASHLLRVSGLKVVFATGGGTVHAVNDVSFSLGVGESLGIVGESGSGKSVTMQAIMGLLRKPIGRVEAGEARYQGADLLTMPEESARALRGSEIAMIIQNPMSSLNPVLTIGRQLTESLEEHRGLSRKVADTNSAEFLELAGIARPRERMLTYPHQFSGGQLQRIGIAMALSCDPKILIADEPTTALDVTIRAQIVELVASLQKRLGMAIIWISHDLALVAGLVDRIAVMYGGSIVEEASVRQIFQEPRHPYTRGLLRSIPSVAAARGRLVPIPGSPPNLMEQPDRCVFAPRCARARDRCRTEKPRQERVAEKHRLACFEWRSIPKTEPLPASETRAPTVRREISGTILSVTNLKVHFPILRGVLRRQVGAVRAVDGVSFDVIPGETLALVGESGCGKSTVARTIVGLNQPTGGKVEIEGVDYAKVSASRQTDRRRAVQIIFQDPFGSLNPRLTIGRIVSEGLRAQRMGNRRDHDRRVSELLALVGLGDAMRHRYPHELSGGQRQRVGIARALAPSPRLIVADEPISALDVSIQAQVINLLADLKSELGLTYLFIGHDLSMVRHFSDRVAVMYLGRIVEMGPAEDVFTRMLHPYTAALVSAIPAHDPDQAGRQRIILEGTVPDPSNPPPGCPFHTRCRHATDLCRTDTPPLERFDAGSVDGPGHEVACHHAVRIESAREIEK